MKNIEKENRNDNATMVAESAIALLRNGIALNNKSMIKEAYDAIAHDSFSWEGSHLDVLFVEWDELTDEANDILLEG